MTTPPDSILSRPGREGGISRQDSRPARARSSTQDGTASPPDREAAVSWRNFTEPERTRQVFSHTNDWHDEPNEDDELLDAVSSLPVYGGENVGFILDVIARARARRVDAAALEYNVSLAGDANIFQEVDLNEVKPKIKIPLDEDDVFLTEKIHWISGPAGVGKTILAYWKLVQYAKRMKHSAIYECEMGEELAVGLLKNLGATARDLEYIHYFKAKEDGTVANLAKHGRAFCRMLIQREIRILLYDALNPLLVASALNENIAPDVRAFVTAACYPMSDAGGLVLVLDHVGKANQDASRGSSDKPAAGHVDLTLKMTSVFARGVSGAIELTCNKDRTGSIVKGSKHMIQVEARPDGTLRLKPDLWDWQLSEAEPNSNRRTARTQQKIIDYGRDLPDGFTIAAAARDLELSEDSVGKAVGRGARPDANGKVVFHQVRRGLWRVVAE